MSVNLKLSSACFIGGAMALATSLQALTSSPGTGAGDNSNPYAIIVDRNVFRLNPIPPPPPPPEAKPKDLPKVYLSGILKIGDDVRVLFSIPAKDAKNPATYFKLAAGEKDGDLELVNIHPDQQAVDVLVSGTAMTLSMLSNTLTSASAGKAGGGAPGAGPGMRPGAPVPQAPVAAASSGSSAIIVGGGDRQSSVTVAGGGGGGITTIGGNNSSSYGGGGTLVGGGGGGAGASSFGGGTTVSGGGTSSLGVGAGTSPGSQIANTLLSGAQAPANIANLPPANVVPPSQQALDMAAYNELHGGALPMPPGVQAQIDGTTWSPRGNK